MRKDAFTHLDNDLPRMGQRAIAHWIIIAGDPPASLASWPSTRTHAEHVLGNGSRIARGGVEATSGRLDVAAAILGEGGFVRLCRCKEW